MSPCNCGGSKTKVEYVATFSDGSSKTYSSELEAKVAVVRKGGSYKARTADR
jgi:hypothetical protein